MALVMWEESDREHRCIARVMSHGEYAEPAYTVWGRVDGKLRRVELDTMSQVRSWLDMHGLPMPGRWS